MSQFETGRVWLALAIASFALAGCTKRDTGDGIVVTSSTCISCNSPRTLGEMSSREMDETSGIVASSRSDDVFFAQNDSGDTARFFAIGRDGRLLATFVYSSAEVTDCEDIARGPCDGTKDTTKSCLFIADIGDNRSKRKHVTIYRVEEPSVMKDATIASDPLVLTYPDGAHDAETLLVHPVTGVLTIVTKVAGGASGIYEVPMPFSPGAPAVLTKVGSITSPVGSPRFTSGSVKPDGRGILLRTYTHVYFVPMRPEQTVANALKAPLCSLPVAREDQGETITWQRTGASFVTTSEGKGAPLSAVDCSMPEPASSK